MLKPELGKTYVVDSYVRSESDPSRFVTVVGMVDPDTIEYEYGFRFYTDTGWLYTQDGQCAEADEFHTYGLIEEVGPDHKTDYIQRLYLDVSLVKQIKEFIHIDDPAFTMALGYTYITRMGRLHLVTERRYGLPNNTVLYDAEGCVFSWDEKGKIAKDGASSMHDILCMSSRPPILPIPKDFIKHNTNRQLN